MFGRKTRLIAYLRQQLAYLSGQLAQSEQKAEGFKSIAAQALELAREQQARKADVSMRVEPSEYLPSYKIPEVRFCPECGVSVRSESWPQECPCCHVVFGFGAD